MVEPPITLDDRALAEFAQGSRGDLIGATDSGYDEAPKLYNGLIDKSITTPGRWQCGTKAGARAAGRTRAAFVRAR
jgi:hypothetical protein